MLCRACEKLESRGELPPAALLPAGAALCSRCGHLLGTDDIVQRVRRKQSQLAQFGLAGPRRPLLKPPPSEDP